MSSRQTIRISDELISESHLRMTESIKLIDVATAINRSLFEIQKTYEIAVAESRQTLSLLQELEFELGDRVLEVGAGYGLASICLAMMGFEVVALEPGGIGFEENRLASIAFAESCGVLLSHISESAETFDFSQTEKFRLIVSNNVLEHIPDVDRALTNLNHALSTDGVMVHSCANYSFPFEPHFGIPLVPMIPRLTSRLLPLSIVSSGLWQSLNFIKYSQVKRNSRRSQMTCRFRKGTMSKSIKRLRLDQEFSERHAAISRLVRWKLLYRLLLLVTSIPRRFATPMDFIICFPGKEESRNVRTWMRSK